MAARTRKIRHDENTRLKIQASQIINRLTNHVLNDTEMSSTQVTAALGLLKKAVPDLTSVDSTVKQDSTVRVVSDKPMTAEDWEQQYSDHDEGDLGSTGGASESTH